jgi:hypothetical protein
MRQRNRNKNDQSKVKVTKTDELKKDTTWPTRLSGKMPVRCNETLTDKKASNQTTTLH